MPKEAKICFCFTGSFDLCSPLAYITTGTSFEGTTERVGQDDARKMMSFVAYEGIQSKSSRKLAS